MENNEYVAATDGRLYGLNDMPKVDCADCEGCHDCCTGMDDTIIIDPYDMYQFAQLGENYNTLSMKGIIELGPTKGIVLPHIKMNENDACPYLSEEGRCSIHDKRPGMCRLFPLGRSFEESGLKYILLTEECKLKKRQKMKVAKWVGVEPAGKYHAFVEKWHELRVKAAEAVGEEQNEG
nr:YkgJ family cysteine cluster protein [Lachnospiraceae bacterium]